jgi:hypothetical protein
MSFVPAMSSFRIRPCFEQVVPLAPAEMRTRIVAAFARQAPGFEVRDFPGFIGLHIGETQRRFYSPRLFLVLDPEESGGTRVQGTYGPEIEVWGIFLYGYLITGLLGVFSGVLGAAQLTIGTEPWGWWITGSMGVLAGLLYLGAQLGQKFGAWQTFQLHQAYQAAVGVPTEIR